MNDAQEGKYHIVVVDDEPRIGRLLKDLLEMQNHTAKTFIRGAEALAYVDEHVDQVDLLLTDLQMPDMTGFELEEQLHAMVPELPIGTVSGSLDIEDFSRRAPEVFDGILAKPFDPEDLYALVQGMMETK